MTELAITKHAKSYLDQLAQGIDPISGQTMPDDAVLNQDRLARCFLYVSGLLEKIIENSEKIEEQKRQANWTPVLFATIKQRMLYSDQPSNISYLVRQINRCIPPNSIKAIQVPSVTRWLVKQGFLQLVPLPNGQMKKEPTEQGESLGLCSETRIRQDGSEYQVISYSETAQRYIVEHLDDIVTYIFS